MPQQALSNNALQIPRKQVGQVEKNHENNSG
jgi:hypothetical protein